ncbi:B602L [African swine fever virus]|nr:B602L [African swine fever virus]WGG62875.1 B602L [African swine fever virus]WGG63042.1 B602L [African swine fever virus]WGG63210.1 B602L [African swine fever virus]WGG63377.1 B602L [African swine fever virus]
MAEFNIDELLKNILEDPSTEISEETLKQLYQRTNPYKQFKNDSRVAFCSFTNLREQYIRRLIMTSFIGYVFKALQEWMPSYSKPTHTTKTLLSELITLVDTLKQETNDVPSESVVNTILSIADSCKTQTQKSKEAKTTIDSFLREHFVFDPNLHAQSAYTCADTNVDTCASMCADTNVDTCASMCADTNVDTCASTCTSTEYTDLADPERIPLHIMQKTLNVPNELQADIDAITQTPQGYRAAAHILQNIELHQSIKHMLENPRAFKPILFNTKITRYLSQHIPPQDTFYKWNYYIEDNYEELRAATESIYPEKPDLEFAFIIYDVVDSSNQQKVDEFYYKYKDQIFSEVSSIQLGNWTLLGSFKANRERYNYFNQNNEIIKRILDRHEEDLKIGKEILRNTIYHKKAKNIQETGPDAPGLSIYNSTFHTDSGIKGLLSFKELKNLEKASGNIKKAREYDFIDDCEEKIKQLLSKENLTPDEESELIKTKKQLDNALEMLNVPDDTIRVDMWVNNNNKLEKEILYTKAEL